MSDNISVSSRDIILQGTFYDGPVEGLEYSTQTLSGTTNQNGEFHYRPDETITFCIGGLIFGSTLAAGRLTTADLVIEVSGDVNELKNQKTTNMARFIQSLDEDGNIENGVTITSKTRSVVDKYRYKINFDQSEQAFTQDHNMLDLFAELKLKLRTAAQARNHLRRTLYGIKKMTDVKIPTRDGSYLLANIFRPIKSGKYPIIMSLGAYGKAFTFGRICNEEDLLTIEEIEDGYFQGKQPEPSTFSNSPNGHPIVPHTNENWELVNTVDWVPKGYVVIRVDARGVGKTPGLFEQFSLQEANDFYDAIEWAGTQEWSNGNVGLWGASYYAMNQYNVAQLQPPHLKAMVPISGDINSYRDYIYSGGGLYNPFNFVAKNSCGEWQGVEWTSVAISHPFDDPEIYGPRGSLCISPDMSKITVPFWSSMGTQGNIHTRGSSEAYILAASEYKKLTISSSSGMNFWKSHMEFFDYWLKGIDNGIMNEPPIKMMVRTGWGGYYWQNESEWPIARTQYTKYYLDAVPSHWEGDGKRHDFLVLSKEIPTKEMETTYSAEVKYGIDPAWSYGASFITEPLSDDMVIAGYIKLVVWVSSSSYDMQIHATVRVIDENGVDVPYPLLNPGGGVAFPVGQGALKVSHRKLDPERSNIYRPYHTHKKEDYQPLTPGEVIEAEVELWPTTALIRKGCRIRLNIQPSPGEGLRGGVIDPIDNGYVLGAANTIYTGPYHSSYLQLPVIPSKP